MNNTRRGFLAAILALALLTPGCALLTTGTSDADKARDVQRIAYSATSIGASVALEQHPEWAPKFQLAANSLEKLVAGNQISGQQLREILTSLPVKELRDRTARIAIDAGTMMFDTLTGKPIDLETTPYVLAAARGILDGLKVALAP